MHGTQADTSNFVFSGNDQKEIEDFRGVVRTRPTMRLISRTSERGRKRETRGGNRTEKQREREGGWRIDQREATVMPRPTTTTHTTLPSLVFTVSPPYIENITHYYRRGFSSNAKLLNRANYRSSALIDNDRDSRLSQ